MIENTRSETSKSPSEETDSRLSYLLHLADNALILGQRNAEWCGHGPVLEQDIAITNISLDLIGQARNFYQYAALLSGEGATEDSLAFLRSEREFKNCLLVELPRGDWAQTILRQFFFSAFQHLLFAALQNSRDKQVAAIAGKSIREVTYHLRWSSEWVIRLGDGTEESMRRIQNGIGELWPYTGELFVASAYEREALLAGIATDPSLLENRWQEKVKEVFSEAGLPYPAGKWMHSGGKQGRHSEHLGYVLAEMQYMQRAYPGSEW